MSSLSYRPAASDGSSAVMPAVRLGLLSLDFREPSGDPAAVAVELGDTGPVDGWIALPKLCYLCGERSGALSIHDARASDPIWISRTVGQSDGDAPRRLDGENDFLEELAGCFHHQ